ncbi:hypothetical protein PABG_07577 [Paracoccidioides brasiliensis Pb03]|uniref:Uncharacterized protein n=2 Tax=Paracoccidioides brasiliensis TaxID=121759 RepID=C1GLS3_PARBD|nr:uncharacterized protein PADG_08314 [Paracoccidioides brasiliensis Pb18]EEH18517.1 hypothetical protein PABG_07577 [Paracoccidioides brasiliensis Pb03]EEH43389.2 hypothetical protein PADG_08314 [Paracoccidioides brasiliensis Pb18]ODH26098.1 hypothetical protein ACO22_04826 [Paracoccidioides brasiliensis]ODH46489.1 hypothetical protein GX48_07426 [Paracoccidioides brasiliensis]
MATIDVVEITDATIDTVIIHEKSSDNGEKVTIRTDAMLHKFDRTRAAHAATVEIVPKARDKRHAATLSSIRKLHEERSSNGMKHLLFSAFFNGYSNLPSDQDLHNLALCQFPPRALLKAQVCDFYPNHAELQEVLLGDIEVQWQNKPEGAQVRWIHVPVGRGIYHSSIEDLFRHANSQEPRPFENAGHVGFAYVELDALNFRHRVEIEDLRDTYCILSKMEHLSGSELEADGDISTSDASKSRNRPDPLDWECLRGDRNASLRGDLEWRADHLNTDLTFWELVASDIPWQISDGLPICASGPLGRIKPLMNSCDFRVLSSHPSFLDAQLVRNEFRFFHRRDGFLLTMSATKGINYLDARLLEYLRQSPDDILLNPGASAVGQTLKEFAHTGTSTWEKPTAEWLVVHLATEIGTCPHNDTLGHNQISIVEAYQNILRDLKLRTYEPWRRDETVRLTRTFLQCMEEIRFMAKMLASRQDLFTRLRKDVEIHDTEDRKNDAPHNPDGESSIHRVDWALGKIRQQRDDIGNISNEIQNSMNDLLHLRTIEQNELTIVRDSQQRAIMLFTAVTVIFLPLSFCTSYFGMNLQGISDTSRSEQYFWYVCGTAGFLVVSIISVYAFWHPVKDHLAVMREHRKARREMKAERIKRLKRRISSEPV